MGSVLDLVEDRLVSLVDPDFIFGGVAVGAGRKHRCRGTQRGEHVSLDFDFWGERESAFSRDKDKGERPACGGHQDDDADHSINAGDAELS